MIQEDYVTFEQAKALKELGFPQLQELKWYSIYLCKPGDAVVQDVDAKFPEVCAPTQSLVQKWLREVKNIILTLEPEDDYGIEFKFIIHIINEQGYLDFIDASNRGNMYLYEQALSAGIDKCIELLKEKEDVGSKR